MAAEKKPEATIQIRMFTSGKRDRQLVAGIGADAHEGAGAERHQAGIAGQDVEPDRRQREHQERDHHGSDEEVATRTSAPQIGDARIMAMPIRSCRIGNTAMSVLAA
jgi:CRISPR/Cas system CMR subunit Cmr4 (Cas7 group RAMP superfamily)